MRYYEMTGKDIVADSGFDAANLRINLENSDSILILNVTENCPDRVEVLRMYSGARITSHPTGHSLEEKTTYTVQRKWGGLSFGFKERAPECLSSITITYKNSEVIN